MLYSLGNVVIICILAGFFSLILPASYYLYIFIEYVFDEYKKSIRRKEIKVRRQRERWTK